MIKFLNYLYRFQRNISLIGIFNAFRFFVRFKKLNPVDILYLCHDNSRPIFFNGKYYSPLIDSINIRLNKFSNMTMALPFSKYGGDLTYGNVVNLNAHIIIALFKRVLFFRSIALKNKKKDFLIKFYSELLIQIKPKVIIGIQPSTEICIAAKKLNIDVYDVQHGIIEVENKESYYSLEKRKLYNKESWPTYILCRNIESLNKISKSIPYTKPIIIGNLNKYFYSKIYIVNRETKIVENHSKTILFTFQPFYDKKFSLKNKHKGIVFPSILLKLILNSKYDFILKLHPSQIQNSNLFKKHIKAFDKLFLNCNNVEYITCNKNPLEDSLIKSDLHITFNSACVYDALNYNLKTILLDEDIIRLENYYGELMNSKFVKIDPNLKIDFVNCFKRECETNNEDSDHFNHVVDFISQKVL